MFLLLINYTLTLEMNHGRSDTIFFNLIPCSDDLNFILQPLTILPTEKCKRCGFYEKDPLTTEAFEEWELCPTNFVDGDYFHFKEDEFNATFSCPECIFPVSKSIYDSQYIYNSHQTKLSLIDFRIYCFRA